MKYLGFAAADGAEPEDLVIAIDVSLSMATGIASDRASSRLAAAKRATSSLVCRKLEIAPSDRVAIVSFSGSADVELGLTPVTSANVIEEALEQLKPSGSTDIRAGLLAASKLLQGDANEHLLRTLVEAAGNSAFCRLKELLDLGQPTKEGTGRPKRAQRRRRILLLTDGHNNGGGPVGFAKKLKERRGISIDVVGVGRNARDVDESLLKKIASKDRDGSPRYCFIRDAEELVRRFEELATSNLRPLRKGVA